MALASPSLAAPNSAKCDASVLAPGALDDCLRGFEDCDGHCGLPAGSYELAMAEASQCETVTSWAEQVAPGLFRAVCGNDSGEELIGSCEESAWLAFHMAAVSNGNPDAAYEDSLAACLRLDEIGELPVYTEAQ